jgi:hypothetical protein
MAKEIKKKCPLVGEECWGHECEWFIKIRGTNPQTGELIDEYRCSWQWIPVLLVENSQQQRQTGAAVESFRNEMTKQNSDMLKLAASQTKLIGK